MWRTVSRPSCSMAKSRTARSPSTATNRLGGDRRWPFPGEQAKRGIRPEVRPLTETKPSESYFPNRNTKAFEDPNAREILATWAANSSGDSTMDSNISRPIRGQRGAVTNAVTERELTRTPSAAADPQAESSPSSCTVTAGPCATARAVDPIDWRRQLCGRRPSASWSRL
jgi:hypothetical protein